MRPTVILATLCAVMLASSADARPRQTTSTLSRSSVGHHPKQLISRRNRRETGHFIITHRDTARPGMFISSTSFEAAKMNMGRTLPLPQRERVVPPGLHRVMAEGAGRIVGGRPAGCPRRYCGCGASLHIFGRIIPRLNLAANWLRFPRVAPAPGMVAARRGHVFVLKRHIHGRVWLVWDANSGRGKTRVHPRSIAGFTIVDPMAGT